MEDVAFASTFLERAVELDRSMKYPECLTAYQEGISLLVRVTANISDSTLKVNLRQKIEAYIERAENIKIHLEKTKERASFREQIHVKENEMGISYERVFSPFLDSNLYNIDMDDAYIQSPHQCDNFMHFVEICIRLAPNLKTIKLLTGLDDGKNGKVDDQYARLTKISNSALDVSNGRVAVSFHFVANHHTREIRFDNGFVIKSGYGLDWYKQTDRHTAGWIDYSFRKCKPNTIDIFYNSKIHKCP